MWFNANSGRGTNHSKKHSGKTDIRETRVPKQQTNDPIHHVTTANISKESCTSVGRLADPRHRPPAKPIRMARTNRTKPVRKFGSGFAFRDRHSVKIRAMLRGIITNVCVSLVSGYKLNKIN